MLAEKTTHVDEALAHLAQQYKPLDGLAALITGFVDQVQLAEVAAFAVLAGVALDAAIGAQLDGIGAIVDEARQGRDDAAYRLALRARILINEDSGTIEDVLEVAELVLGFGTGLYEIKERYPASFSLEIHGATPVATASGFAKILKTIRPVAVGGALIYSEFGGADTFTFSSGDTEEGSTTQGWAPDDQSSGGHMADAIGS